MNRRKQPRGHAGRILGALWMPLVALIVIAVVGFGVNRIREKSQAISHPPTTRPIPATVVQINPKDVTYEVFGDLGNSGKVSYADLNSEPVDVVLTSLPWSVSETTTSSAVSLSLVAQVDGDSLGCRIRVNGEVREEQVVNHTGAAVACTVTAA
ncbi:MmpS family transport accessory protein [Mycobacteroides abscessus]|uniref:MmpS family transport accessory protein n=1 Tax=Mycobacteroides abscessus TaxID=36809 RepID=UPI0009CDC4E5|nr:MmpS family transport accessory protein [Mycobacteroides abscessus]SKG71679.1 membrane protein MmpS [Mycobacteroides abscessus subsp. bolletii]SKG97337.1 membrane protein MmpS [Mycobacteroides abscessus subsp. bolletii]SKH91443.1 membrane protein MmpS [Mycobacteroides abscessus subsp. bolletii]SKH93019.1 membrane protein MmpS [Mycobacteroides abscessus subsp. bolletii]SKH97265.1 membrane protein MmpS [Mycobacteroides abscessus subsp. bolletii]